MYNRDHYNIVKQLSTDKKYINKIILDENMIYMIIKHWTLIVSEVSPLWVQILEDIGEWGAGR